MLKARHAGAAVEAAERSDFLGLPILFLHLDPVSRLPRGPGPVEKMPRAGGLKLSSASDPLLVLTKAIYSHQPPCPGTFPWASWVSWARGQAQGRWLLVRAH